MKRKNKSGSGCSECDAKKTMNRIKGRIPSYSYNDGDKVTTTDPPINTGNIAPDPVIGNQMNLGMDFECDTSTGANCSNKMGRPFRLGLKGSLMGSKGAYGQPTNLGPGWDPISGQQVDNRIGTNYDYDITGNLGAYLRTDLQPLLFPNDGTKLRGKNWEPWHLDLGYNRKQNLIGTNMGTGSNNITAKLAKTRDQKYGRAGYGGFFGNKGGSSKSGYSYGLQGNYNYDTKQLDNIGVFGRAGMMGPLGVSGYAGINPQTGEPNFGAGMSIKFKKGGTVPSYDDGDNVKKNNKKWYNYAGDYFSMMNPLLVPSRYKEAGIYPFDIETLHRTHWKNILGGPLRTSNPVTNQLVDIVLDPIYGKQDKKITSPKKKGGKISPNSYGDGDDVGVGLGGSELSYGTSGLTTKINPTLNMGKLNIGGEYGGLHSFNDDITSKYFLGGTGRFNFDASGRRVRDWDPRFMGSLSGNVGYGKTGSEKQGNLSNEGLATSGRLDLGVGRPGSPPCIGGSCAPPITPWGIGAFGEYGNKYSLNPGARAGIKGQWNWLSGEGGYDFTKQSPFFKAGLSIPMR